MTRWGLLVGLALAACSREPPFEGIQSAVAEGLRRGDLRSAETNAEKGLRIARERPDPAWERRFTVLFAEVLVEQRRFSDSLALLAGQDLSGAPADPIEARALVARGRATCQSEVGAEAFVRAEADLAEAARLTATFAPSELSGDVSLHRGTCALVHRDFTAAETHFKEAFNTARRERRPSLETRAAGSLGLLRMWTERYDDAADWLRKALDLASSLPTELPAVKTLTNLGWCYYSLGDYDRAIAFLTDAEARANARGYASERLLALQNIGNARYMMRALEEAGGSYRQALAIARDLRDKKRAAELLSNLGIVALEQGRSEEAETFVREALQIEDEIEDLPGKQHSLLAEGQIWAARQDHAKAETLYREVLGSRHSSPALVWETRASLADLRRKTHRAAEAEAEFRKAFAIMEESGDDIGVTEHKISFLSSLGQFYDNYVDFLVERGRAERALEVADRSRSRLLREKRGAETGPSAIGRFHDAARTLDAVILFYWMAPRRSFLWVVTPRRVDLHVLPDEAEVRARVEALQKRILESRDPLEEGTGEAEWLHRNLVGPAAASIPAGSRVAVIPDGPLHQMNFESLVVPSKPRHYWIEDVTLLTAPSLALLGGHNARSHRATGARILVIGDPLPGGDEFPRLPNAATEVDRIAAQFAPSERTIYSGARADPSAYREAEPERFSFIHFAAHAKANVLIPLDSAVILSPRNDAYKLYAREIVDIPLRADLVTLSACRSAGSRTYAGEGLVGLAWAFLSAGAGNVVGGLWNVDDVTTSELMDELYRGLRRGLPPPEALRAAKLRLLRSGTAWGKPFYWAPFVVYTQRPAAGRAS